MKWNLGTPTPEVEKQLIARYDEVCPFSSDCLKVRLGKNWQLVSVYTGQVVNDKVFSGIYNSARRPSGVWGKGIELVDQNNKFGFITHQGNMLCACKYDNVLAFSNTCAIVYIGYKKGFLSLKTGQEIGTIDFDYIGENYGENDEGDTWDIYTVLVKRNGKYGYVNINGELICECKYDFAREFRLSGIATIGIENKFGLIDFKCNVLTEIKYDYIGYFEDSYGKPTSFAKMILNGKEGKLDRLGKEYW